MIKKLFLGLVLLSWLGQAQHTIKGEMQPVESYPWMLLYKLQGAKQDFIAYDSIKNGRFNIVLPSTATSGIYRLVYDQKNQLFVDVIYDQQDIEFKFHPKYPSRLVQFSTSQNNKLFFNYLRAITPRQQQLDSLQVAYFNPGTKANTTLYKELYNELYKIQDRFESMAQGTMAYEFIKASARYNPATLIKDPKVYLEQTKTHFFDAIDFNNKVLDQSTFKHDKINDYIFYLSSSDDIKERTALIKRAIDKVMEHLQTNNNLLVEVQESLLFNFARQQDVAMTNYLLNYYLKLPKERQDIGFINDIKGQLRTAVGNIAPNILWEANGAKETLHNLHGATHYLVVFWSSGCSHCLSELPQLKSLLNNRSDIQVLAIGLEDDQSTPNWKREIAKYPNWIHVFGQDKWKNEYANTYGVSATPSFYLLDAQKKILAKPDDVQALKNSLN